MSKIHRATVITPKLLAETCYDVGEKITQFAVLEEGKELRLADSVETQEGEIFPLNKDSDIVRKEVILLPGRPVRYGSSEALLEEVQKFIHARVDISPSFERIAAQYVLLSWLYDRLNELPYLRARGDYGSGKSRFLRVVGSICYRPIFTAGATTTSPIFRILDQVKGTLVLDEADLNVSDAKNDLVKILNTGYQKGTAVLRSEGKGVFEVRSYDVYGPKIVATRQNFDDHALESRFLIEDMGKSALRKDMPIRLDDNFQQEARQLRNKLLMWRFDNFRRSLVFDDTPIEGLHPRLQQIIIPLLAIMPGEEIRETLLAHARRYNEELIADRGMSWESQAVIAILRLHKDTGLDGVAIKDIARAMNDDLDLTEHVSPRKVGWILRARLQLKALRTGKGFSLSFSRNQEKIIYWRERLGITDEAVSGEEVNNVNVSQEAASSEIRPEDIPF